MSTVGLVVGLYAVVITGLFLGLAYCSLLLRQIDRCRDAEMEAIAVASERARGNIARQRDWKPAYDLYDEVNERGKRLWLQPWRDPFEFYRKGMEATSK